MNLAVITELPLVVLERAARRPCPRACPPSPSRPTCCKPFSDATAKAPMPVTCRHLTDRIAFDAAYYGLQDGFGAHDAGGVAYRCFCGQRFRWLGNCPSLNDYPDICSALCHVPKWQGAWTRHTMRNPKTRQVRYWAIPGQEGLSLHILGGLEKDGQTGAISTDPGEPRQDVPACVQRKLPKSRCPM